MSNPTEQGLETSLSQLKKDLRDAMTDLNVAKVEKKEKWVQNAEIVVSQLEETIVRQEANRAILAAGGSLPIVNYPGQQANIDVQKPFQ